MASLGEEVKAKAVSSETSIVSDLLVVNSASKAEVGKVDMTEITAGQQKKANSSNLPPIKKSTWVPWSKEEFYYPMAYWKDTCGLPDEGIVPVIENMQFISDIELHGVFGEKHGRNGFLLSRCVKIDHALIQELNRVCDGHEHIVNNTISKTFAYGLYAQFILGKKVNWAAFADAKHKGQIGSAHKLQKPKPTGPPIVRISRVYKKAEASPIGLLEEPYVGGFWDSCIVPGIDDQVFDPPLTQALRVQTGSQNVSVSSDQVEKNQPADTYDSPLHFTKMIQCEIDRVRIELGSSEILLSNLRSSLSSLESSIVKQEEQLNLCDEQLKLDSARQETLESTLNLQLAEKQQITMELEALTDEVESDEQYEGNQWTGGEGA